MKIICQLTGGSRMYGLETPESDVDTRGVFLNSDPADILGLSRGDVFKKEGEDTVLFELRHFLKSLRNTNTQAIEILFAEHYDQITEEFSAIRENRLRLIDSVKLYSSLKGYMQNERRLANGERTGSIGSKRKEQIEKYGFSPKNFSHLFRLAHCGAIFFRTSFYPVNLSLQSKAHEFILSVKTEPEKYTKEYLNSVAEKLSRELDSAFDGRNETYKFDIDFANHLCLEFYLPFLLRGQS